MAKKVLLVGREVEITFSVNGHVRQQVKLVDGCALTVAQIQDGLNLGKFVTTIQEDGTLDITATGETIGTIVDVFNECEYTDFYVADDED